MSLLDHQRNKDIVLARTKSQEKKNVLVTRLADLRLPGVSDEYYPVRQKGNTNNNLNLASSNRVSNRPFPGPDTTFNPSSPRRRFDPPNLYTQGFPGGQQPPPQRRQPTTQVKSLCLQLSDKGHILLMVWYLQSPCDPILIFFLKNPEAPCTDKFRLFFRTLTTDLILEATATKPYPTTLSSSAPHHHYQTPPTTTRMEMKIKMSDGSLDTIR